MIFELNGKMVHAFMASGHASSRTWGLNVGTSQSFYHWGRIYLYSGAEWRFQWNVKGPEALEDYLIDVLIAWYQ